MEQLAHIIQVAIQAGVWHPIKFGRSGTKLSHNFFADDMVLFAESSTQQIEIVLSYLNKFCESSGAKVSVSKTKVYFSNIMFGKIEVR